MTRILIVDDNARVRAALRLCLKMKEDWVVCGEADNGDAAIELVRTVKPDVVLLDYAMPVMNGLEAAKTLRAMMPEVPLILFTVHRSANLESDACVAGISAVISKVEGVTALVDRVRSLLEPA